MKYHLMTFILRKKEPCVCEYLSPRQLFFLFAISICAISKVSADVQPSSAVITFPRLHTLRFAVVTLRLSPVTLRCECDENSG